MTDMRELIETVTLSENAGSPAEAIMAQIDALNEQLHDAVWAECHKAALALSAQFPGTYLWIVCVNNTNMIHMYPAAGQEPDSIPEEAQQGMQVVFQSSDYPNSHYGISLSGEIVAHNGKEVTRAQLREHAQSLPQPFMAVGEWGRESYVKVS